MDPMLGMIFMVPWAWAPNGYQSCQGQLLNIQQYEALYSLMGVAYGGNGSTTFGLPDLQTRTAYGMGTGPAGNYFISSGSNHNQVGTPTVTLSVANMPSHNHTAQFSPSGGGTPVSVSVTVNPISVNIPALPVTVNALMSNGSTPTFTSGCALSSSQGGTQGAAQIWTPNGTPNTPLANGTATTSATTVTANATASATVSGGSSDGGTIAIGNTGGNSAFGIIPPGVILNYIIAVQGLYPDRP